MRQPRILIAASLCWAISSHAQVPVTMHGVAYDSLHGVRLSAAFIALVGSRHTTTSDSLGNFSFDSIAPGAYQLVMQHDVLDAIGMSGATARVAVTDGRDTVRISVPSFATLWRVACHNNAPPPDSGIVFGTVRGVGGHTPQAGATVSGGWLDIGVNKKALSQRQWHLDIESDSTGGYALCGVPLLTGIRLRAATDSAASGFIDLDPLDRERVQRRDLILGKLIELDSTMRGTIVGQVRRESGPVPNARVVANGVPESRTADDGRFTLRGVQAGTQQIEVSAIGLAPTTAIVDVIANDTARVEVRLGKVTVLDSVHVTGEAIARQRLVTQFTERRKQGIGRFKDSTQLAGYNTFALIFGDMPVSVRVGRGGVPIFSMLGPGCERPLLWVDRVETDPRDMVSIRPSDIAALEVYNAGLAPMEFKPKNPTERKCAVVIWTKRGWP